MVWGDIIKTTLICSLQPPTSQQSMLQHPSMVPCAYQQCSEIVLEGLAGKHDKTQVLYKSICRITKQTCANGSVGFVFGECVEGAINFQIIGNESFPVGLLYSQ
jgi:hypothetical protein